MLGIVLVSHEALEEIDALRLSELNRRLSMLLVMVLVQLLLCDCCCMRLNVRLLLLRRALGGGPHGSGGVRKDRGCMDEKRSCRATRRAAMKLLLRL